MSLADELLADLEDDDDVEEPAPSMEVDVDDVEAQVIKPLEEVIKITTIKEIAQLRGSERLERIMNEMAKFQSQDMNSRSRGPLEINPEYQLIVEANNLAVDIDNEIVLIHRFVRDKYSKRFPELESLVVQPQEYMMTVRELGNDLDKAKNNEALQQFLTQATIMVVSVTASTTQGQLLTEVELEEIREACDMASELNSFKQQIYEYVESRMTYIAPNLSAIVGASTAAKVMGFEKESSALVATKCILAARVDASHDYADGSIGRSLREDIEKKFDKLTEPPPVKFVKPLPKPIDPGRKKRGGKRVRKMKERYAMTEMRKQNNRLNFADIEDDAYQEDLGYTRGTIGKSRTGRIRLPQVDEKTKVRISKTLQKNLQKQQQIWGGSTTVKKQVSGTASSVAFTPLQGLEIVNPQAAEKNISEINAKYFSNIAGFVKVNNKSP